VHIHSNGAITTGKERQLARLIATVSIYRQRIRKQIKTANVDRRSSAGIPRQPSWVYRKSH
jgi:hypothetical protein